MKEVIDVYGNESIQKAEVQGSDSYYDLRKKIEHATGRRKPLACCYFNFYRKKIIETKEIRWQFLQVEPVILPLKRQIFTHT